VEPLVRAWLPVAVNKLRSIAQLKTWRILHTDYRRPYPTFTTINAVLGIIFTYTP